LSDDENEKAFFTCWTRKESFIKALGLGLSHPLNSFSVSLNSNEKNWTVENENLVELKDWSFFQLNPDPNYVAALAVAGKIQSLHSYII
jgi:4'-phosphopantetheinyl transferase